ncbi:MAG: hypothetical protein ACJAUZ_001309, partial [Flavobacteriaceae bacterium]
MIVFSFTPAVRLVSPRVITAVALCLLGAVLNFVHAAPLPSPPLLSANSYLLFDHTSG